MFYIQRQEEVKNSILEKQATFIFANKQMGKTEFIKKYPGRMKIIQLGYFREQRAKVRACTRPWRLPRKQKETRKACFFLFQMKFYFSSPRALRSIFCQKPFFFSGCSKEPRMPRTPVM